MIPGYENETDASQAIGKNRIGSDNKVNPVKHTEKSLCVHVNMPRES